MPSILVIDDDVGVRTAIKVLLEMADHKVTLAADGRTGVRLIEQQPYDLVIVDVFMPGLNGLETIKALRALRRDMPIVVMSGASVHTASESVSDLVSVAAKLGADRSIRKPFGSSELLETVRSCLDRPAASA